MTKTKIINKTKEAAAAFWKNSRGYFGNKTMLKAERAALEKRLREVELRTLTEAAKTCYQAERISGVVSVSSHVDPKTAIWYPGVTLNYAKFVEFFGSKHELATRTSGDFCFRKTVDGVEFVGLFDCLNTKEEDGNDED